MSLLHLLAAAFASVFAVILLVALAAWWARERHGWQYPGDCGPDMLERREREGVQLWESRR